jgi:periplasmic protein TonB
MIRPAHPIPAALLSSLAVGLLCVSALAHAQAVPKILKKVPPDFPASAISKGVDKGVLKARVNVDGAGLVTEVAIIDTQPANARILNRTVVDALKEWKFEGSGKPAAFELQIVLTSD